MASNGANLDSTESVQIVRIVNHQLYSVHNYALRIDFRFGDTACASLFKTLLYVKHVEHQISADFLDFI